MTWNDALLVIHIQTVVPLTIMGIISSGGLTDSHIRKAQEYANVIAEKGDLILFKSKKKRGSAEAIHALCYGLAVLAFCPGGVTFAGQHFSSEDYKGVANEA